MSKDFKNNTNFRTLCNGETPEKGDIGWTPGHVAIYAGNGYFYTASPGQEKYILTNGWPNGSIKKWYIYEMP